MVHDPPVPADEARRLAALRDFRILDTDPDPRFDRLTRLAARLMRAPIALVSLVDTDRQWFKARQGVEAAETPRRFAFCGHAILGGELMVVPDARDDPRFADNPLVTGPPHIRFYAGMPLVVAPCLAVGTLCVIDRTPRSGVSADEAAAMQDLARAVVDLLDAHRAEWEAKRGERLLRTALSSISEGFSIFDQTDRLLFFNEQYRALYGASADLIVPGVRFEEIVREGARRGQYAEADRDGIEAFVAKRLARHHDPGPPHEQELGDGRWLRVAESRAEDGSLVGVRTDITQLKRTERALEEARRAAEDASQAKSRFLAMMSHEIRTPLNGVLGALGLLTDVGLADAHQRLVDTARRSAESLLTLLNDILDLTKIEAGKVTLEPTPFALAGLVADALSLFAPRTRAKGLVIATAFAPDLPEGLRGDAGRIRQMLMNYLSNAVKFTDAGTITVTARRTADGEIEVAVADTGIGIAADQQNRLFREFDRLDAPRAHRVEGTGLGLMITRRLAELMGGSVGVDSTPGQGSRFWFRLPLEACDPPIVAPGAQTDDGNVLRTRDGGRPRVLLAEDNPANQMVARLMLERLGCTVDLAATGAEALVAVTSRGYDVVLMDISMPEMDGVAAAQAIRELPGAAGRLPIIAATANAFPDDLASYRQAGMTGHVIKPILRTALRAGLVDAGLVEVRPAAVSAPAVPALAPASAAAPACDWVDRRLLDEALGELPPDDRNFLIDVFLSDCEAQLAALAAPSGPDDLPALKVAAHTLKGSSGTFGATRLADHLLAIEQACRDGRIEGLADRIDQARAVGAATLDALRALRSALVDAAAEAEPAAGPAGEAPTGVSPAGKGQPPTGTVLADAPSPDSFDTDALSDRAAVVIDRATVDALDALPGVEAAVDVLARLDRDLDRLLAELRAGLAAGEFARVAPGSRALQDIAGVLGDHRLTDAARRLEEACRDGAPAGRAAAAADAAVGCGEVARRALAAALAARTTGTAPADRGMR